MGRYDSTKTRVQPLCDFIDNDIEKVNLLLKEINPDIKITSEIESFHYGLTEKAFPPPYELLKWCINNYDKLTIPKNFGVKDQSSMTYKKRKALFDGNEVIKNEALNLLDENPEIQKKWYLFEGYTHPDIFIETSNTILIGEAKRTEQKLTTKTEWLDTRDQLIRHIDSFILNTSKTIFSFYLISAENKDKYSMDRYLNIEYFKNSLPHRNKEAIKLAKETYIGDACWEELEKSLKISFPDTIQYGT